MTDHRLHSAPRYHSNNTLLARGTTNPESTEFVLLYSSMFGIASFNFILLLIDDWQLAMQVNIRQSFFANPLQQSFRQNFLPPKFFTTYTVYDYRYSYYQ